MTTEALQDRFSFPHPNGKERSLEYRLVRLMLDGKRRSKEEMCAALGLHPGTEITARLRDVRNRRGAAASATWPYEDYSFTDARSEGPDLDGIYRYALIRRQE